MSHMTAGERREKEIRKIMQRDLAGEEFDRAKELYEAGRSSGLDEAAQAINHMPRCGEEAFRKRREPLGVYVEIPCTCGAEHFRAAIRALKP